MLSDKKLSKRIAVACEALSEEKREFIIGYAEGVIAMMNQQKQQLISQEQKPAS